MPDMPTFTVPGLSDWLNSLEGHHWFLVSDVAGILGAAVTNVSWLTLLTIGLFIGTFYALWRSSFGLRLRSCGEAPISAETLGVNVYSYKYAAVLVSEPWPASAVPSSPSGCTSTRTARPAAAATSVSPR